MQQHELDALTKRLEDIKKKIGKALPEDSELTTDELDQLLADANVDEEIETEIKGGMQGQDLDKAVSQAVQKTVKPLQEQVETLNTQLEKETKRREQLESQAQEETKNKKAQEIEDYIQSLRKEGKLSESQEEKARKNAGLVKDKDGNVQEVNSNQFEAFKELAEDFPVNPAYKPADEEGEGQGGKKETNGQQKQGANNGQSRMMRGVNPAVAKYVTENSEEAE